MGDTAPKSSVPRATPGGGGAGLRPAGATTGQGREETYGPYGGRYVPETLIPALDQLTAAWEAAKADPAYGP